MKAIIQWLIALFNPKKKMAKNEEDWSSGDYDLYADLKAKKSDQNLAKNKSQKNDQDV